MGRNAATTEKLRNLIAKIETATESGELHWERQAGSAHRYARLNNNLLILGPTTAVESGVPRYLFVTPFDSPDCIEINSDDAELGAAVMKLVRTVDQRSRSEPPTDPFGITEQMLERLERM